MLAKTNSQYRNRAAALLSLLGLCCLGPSYFLPFFSMDYAGKREVYTILSGLHKLFANGDWILGLLILVFSVVNPIMKFILSILATTSLVPLNNNARRAVKAMTAHVSKWSMLEVFIAAVFVTAVQMKDVIEFHIQYGLFLFGLAIMMSIMVGMLIKIDSVSEDSAPSFPGERTKESAAGNVSDQGEKSIGRAVVLVAGLIALAVSGIVLMVWPLDLKIDRVELTQHGGGIMPPEGPTGFLESPNLYLRIRIDMDLETNIVDTPIREGTPVGDGLSWNIEPTSIDQIKEITVMNKPLGIWGKAVDRVTVRGETNQGQHYTLHLTGPTSISRVAGFILLVSGMAPLVGLIVRIIFRYTL